MREFLLERFCYSEMGTFGIIQDSNFKSYTVEDPWKNNAKNISCIPEGVYQCKRTSRPKHGNTFVIINEDLGIAEYPKPGMRDSCLIHVANTILDVEGCIGLGNTLGCLGSNWAVLASGTIPDGAVRRFMQYMEGEDEFQLTIVQGKGAF
jgi:Family of unknown function (DUF5675)